jgi:tetratricopeptide (TPR) repeat protein
MPLQASSDFGARHFDGSGQLKVHNHLFPAANTGLAWLIDREDAVKSHQEFLKDVVRVDLFGVREEGAIDGKLHAPLRPQIPTLEPGKRYLLETVIRTLKLGHPFTQGTADSNEVWLDVTVTAGDRVIGRSGAIDDARGNEVDPWSHFVNVFMLDRDGNRINRRNPQDIFVPLYNHQIPPGSAATVHYGFEVPQDVNEPVTVEVKLQYRKFDTEYMQFVAKDSTLRGRREPDGTYVNELPITTLATDRVTFKIAGLDADAANSTPKTPAWERWNDYGIGQLLKGKAELKQAAEAFAEVEKAGRYDGPLNLARVLLTEGEIDQAAAAIERAASHSDPVAPPWTMAWLSGMTNQQQGRLREAERNFRSVLEDRTPEMIERKFDFSLDYEVRNLLGQTLFERAHQLRGESRKEERTELLKEAVRHFEQTLDQDSENVTAHYNLHLLHAELGNAGRAEFHRDRHAAYKPDDNAAERAVQMARKKYPAANHAAEAVVIYPLQRSGAPGLPADIKGWDAPPQRAHGDNVSSDTRSDADVPPE